MSPVEMPLACAMSATETEPKPRSAKSAVAIVRILSRALLAPSARAISDSPNRPQQLTERSVSVYPGEWRHNRETLCGTGTMRRRTAWPNRPPGRDIHEAPSARRAAHQPHVPRLWHRQPHRTARAILRARERRARRRVPPPPRAPGLSRPPPWRHRLDDPRRDHRPRDQHQRFRRVGRHREFHGDAPRAGIADADRAADGLVADRRGDAAMEAVGIALVLGAGEEH